MSKQPKTPIFVTTIPLKLRGNQENILHKRFEAARQIYNACLGEALRRLDLMRQSKQWQAARKMERGKARNKAFSACDKTFGFTDYSIQSYTKQFTGTWLNDHVDTQTAKKLANRAFKAVQEYLFKSERGRPRFKRHHTLNAVESINNLQGIRWQENKVVWRTRRGAKPLILDAIIDQNDPVIAHGLGQRVKYVRLVRRRLNGRVRFYAQLVNEGYPYQSPDRKRGSGVVGLDLGPSTIAAVGPDKAFLKRFCAELQDKKRDIRRLQRKLDRQRRANNPQNYNADGTVITGSKRWHQSKRQQKTEAKLAEMQRKLAEHRKSLHGQLINEILAMGNVIRLEKLSYKAFQRMFGKSIQRNAPGEFVARLRQKAASLTDVIVEEFPTYNTRLSQRCHHCGRIRKKSLSQRWHKCECGIVAQRDLYSAFLATCVEDEAFNAALANERWAGVGSLLQAALDDVVLTGDTHPASFGLGQSRSQSSVTGGEDG